MEMFMKAIEAHAATMPETAIPPDRGLNPSPGPLNSVGLANSAAGAAGALAGWAMTSISKKLAATDLQSGIGGSVVSPPSQANGTGDTLAPPGAFISTPSFSQASPSSVPTSSSKGMKLGGNRTGSLVDELAAEAAPVVHAPGAWDDEGDDDLMDVNADGGDWSEFAKAPGAPELEAVHDPDAWGDMLDSSSKPASPPPPVAALPNLSAFAPAPRKPAASPATAKSKSPSAPQPKAASSLVPPKQQQTRSSSVPRASRNASDARAASPAHAPEATDDWDNSDSAWKAEDSTAAPTAGTTPTTPLSAMSKEEKAAEMARRKEERKQRIAQLKEQKKKG
ncbi:hypothetical protein FS837_002764 [Tulasnella sp. UAMH 9824]|nr:hypothetical protein FS837_002764 [Tulasnella sp. UAMH 9824]